jgi:hypothetical protein
MEKKGSKSLIMAIIAVVVIAIVVIAVVFVFILPGNDSSKFHGHWAVSFSGFGQSIPSGYWSFYENSSMRAVSYAVATESGNIPMINFIEDEENLSTIITSGIEIKWGTYRVEGGKLYVSGISDSSITESIDIISDNVGIDYEIVNDNQITFTFFMFPMTLTRISESEIETATEFGQHEWENINITLSAFEDEHYNWINLTRSSISYYGDHAPSEWGYIQHGDIIEIGDYTEYVFTQFTWIPTDDWLGGGSFNSDV